MGGRQSFFTALGESFIHTTPAYGLERRFHHFVDFAQLEGGRVMWGKALMCGCHLCPH